MKLIQWLYLAVGIRLLHILRYFNSPLTVIYYDDATFAYTTHICMQNQLFVQIVCH